MSRDSILVTVWIHGEQITLRLTQPYQGEFDAQQVISRFRMLLNEKSVKQFTRDDGVEVWIRPCAIDAALFGVPVSR